MVSINFRLREIHEESLREIDFRAKIHRTAIERVHLNTWEQRYSRKISKKIWRHLTPFALQDTVKVSLEVLRDQSPRKSWKSRWPLLSEMKATGVNCTEYYLLNRNCNLILGPEMIRK